MNIVGKIREAYELSVDIKKYTERYDKLRKEILGEFDKGGSSSKGDTIRAANITAKRIVKHSIIYHADKLKKKLEPEIFKAVTTRTYTVNDIEGLIELLKEHGIKPKEFKSYLDITTQVNKQELEKLFDIGAITKAEIDGTYDVKQISEYVSLSKDN